ncbi:hypothetical protein D3C86_2035820 [compost metagenome]
MHVATIRSLVPVQEEPALNLINSSSFDPEMRITPVAHFLVETQVLIPDIETADIRNLAVYDTQLPVIAVVDPEINQPEQRWKEYFHIPSVID